MCQSYLYKIPHHKKIHLHHTLAPIRHPQNKIKKFQTHFQPHIHAIKYLHVNPNFFFQNCFSPIKLTLVDVKPGLIVTFPITETMTTHRSTMRTVMLLSPKFAKQGPIAHPFYLNWVES